MNQTVKALVVDDSAAMARFLSTIIDAHPELETVGTAADAFEARDQIKRLNPDVITLDIEMPRMDGMTFLRNLIRLHPMPVVMVSSLTAAGSSLTLEALEIGALDAIVKRQPGDDAGLQAYIEEIQSKLINAGRANVSGHHPPAQLRLPRAKLTSWQQKIIHAPSASISVHRVLVIGASTGGPQALRSVLASLKPEGVSVIIAQHISEQFVASLAERLGDVSAFEVAVANHGDALQPGRALIAPGSQNLHVVRAGGELYCHLEAPLPGQVHTPSVDHLFESAARVAGASAVGLVLTGMGQDGAQGLQQLHRKGALTLVQDEASSAVWGMPGAAVQLGAADGDVPLQVIAESLNRLLYKSE